MKARRVKARAVDRADCSGTQRGIGCSPAISGSCPSWLPLAKGGPYGVAYLAKPSLIIVGIYHEVADIPNRV
jgi:hypothetical protein